MTTIYERPQELLQALIRFDTTNPPGNEAACVDYIAGLCHSLGIETQDLRQRPCPPESRRAPVGTGQCRAALALRACGCGQYGEPGLGASAIRRA